MKNFSKILEAMRSIALIALVAVIGFSMAGCGEDDGGIPGTKGRLTITGLDDYEGKYVVAYRSYATTQNRNILAAAGFNDEGTIIDAVQISGGNATLKVWEFTPGKVLGYNKTESISLNVYIFDHTPATYESSFQNVFATEQVGVSFDEGVATREIYVESVDATLSDNRFNGTFMYSYSSFKYEWEFNGTTKAKYTSTYEDYPSTTYDFEIKLVDGHLWGRQWNNQFSQWSDRGAYSFSSDGKTLTLGSSAYTKQE